MKSKTVKKEQQEEKVYAVGVKGFGPGMICRGKQYAENTVFEEPEAELCESGIHYCENPLDVLNFYPLIGEDGKPKNSQRSRRWLNQRQIILSRSQQRSGSGRN